MQVKVMTLTQARLATREILESRDQRVLLVVLVWPVPLVKLVVLEQLVRLVCLGLLDHVDPLEESGPWVRVEQSAAVASQDTLDPPESLAILGHQEPTVAQVWVSELCECC